MSQSDDTNPNRGRPVLMRVDGTDLPSLETLEAMAKAGDLWIFCGEFAGREPEAVDAAHERCGVRSQIYKAFPLGSWPGGYLRD